MNKSSGIFFGAFLFCVHLFLFTFVECHAKVSIAD